MAAPWEDTIVMALRDAQWMDDDNNPMPPPNRPDLFIKMDGDTEKALGDVIFRNDERLYLFEVKSSKGGVATEWNKRDVKGDPKEKAAFISLCHLMNNLNSNVCLYTRAYELSLECHHAVYWSDAVFDHDDTFGNIMVVPYILACSTPSAGSRMPAHPDGLRYEVAELTNDGSYLFSDMLPFSVIRKRTGHIVVRNALDESSQGFVLGQIGSLPLDFFEYLKFLLDLGGGGSGALNAVMCSDQGTFFKNIKSLDELRSEYKSTGNYGAGANQYKKPKASLPRVSMTPSIVPKRNTALVFPAAPPAPPAPAVGRRPS